MFSHDARPPPPSRCSGGCGRENVRVASQHSDWAVLYISSDLLLFDIEFTWRAWTWPSYKLLSVSGYWCKCSVLPGSFTSCYIVRILRAVRTDWGSKQCVWEFDQINSNTELRAVIFTSCLYVQNISIGSKYSRGSTARITRTLGNGCYNNNHHHHCSHHSSIRKR